MHAGALQAPAAVPAQQPLETTAVSQSLHPHEPPESQAVPTTLPAAAPRQDPENPTSVAEDEVDTIIANTNEADR